MSAAEMSAWGIVAVSALVVLVLTLLGVLTGRIVGLRTYTPRDQYYEQLTEPKEQGSGGETITVLQTQRVQVYREVLTAHNVWMTAVLYRMTEPSETTLNANLHEMKNSIDKLQALQPATEVVGSLDVIESSSSLYTTLLLCRDRLHKEIERYKELSGTREPEGESSIWQDIQRLVQKEARQHRVEENYLELRNHMRTDLGLEAIHTPIVSSVEALQGALSLNKLEGLDLASAELAGANFFGAYLQGAELRNADLRGADLRRADLRRADLQEAHLEESNLEEAMLGEANLRGAHLEYTVLRDADLRQADLRDANLIYADLRGANVMQTRLEGADLAGANLVGTKSALSSLMEADTLNLEGAIMPDGSLHD